MSLDDELPCGDCGHARGDHGNYGCQLLSPVRVDGRLERHDRCPCKRVFLPLPELAVCPRCHGERYTDCGLAACLECPVPCRLCNA